MNALLEFTLTADFKEAKKSKSDEWFEAKLQSVGVELDAKIKVRGQSRRDDCDYPPLWLQTKKQKESAGAPWPGFRRAKLVRTCQNGEDRKGHSYKQRVYREYLLYRLYYELFEEAFKTRPFEASFYQKGNNPKLFQTTFGFFVERPRLLEKRLGWTELDVNGLDGTLLNELPIGNQIAFSWATGDTDKIISPNKIANVKAFNDSKDETRVVFYDLDWGGFVRGGAWNPEREYMKGVCHSKNDVENSLKWVTKDILPAFTKLTNYSDIKSSDELKKEMPHLQLYIEKAIKQANIILNDNKKFKKFYKKSSATCNRTK